MTAVLAGLCAGAAFGILRPGASWIAVTRNLASPSRVGTFHRKWPRGTSWAIVPTLVVAVMFLSPRPSYALIGIAACIGGATAVRIWMLRRKQSTRRRYQQHVSAGLETLADGLRAGLPPASALAQIDGPAGQILAPVRAAVAMGSDVPDALSRAAEHTGAESLSAVAAAWHVAERCGAPLAAVLDNVTDNVRHERETQRHIVAGVSPARATAQLMAVLPVFGVIVGRGLGTDPIDIILTTTAGAACLLVGVLLACAGLWWVERIAAGAEQ